MKKDACLAFRRKSAPFPISWAANVLCILDRSRDEYSSNIAGFKGKMGQAACQMVLADPDLDLVAVLDPFESESEWQGIPVFQG